MDGRQKLSDRSILKQATKDDRRLAVLLQRYRMPLYNFVYRFVADRETAEDLVQETFLRCLQHNYQDPVIDQVAPWLYTIAGNLARTELRWRQRWHWVSIGPGPDNEGESFCEPADEGPLPGAQIDRKTVRESVIRALEYLPEEYRRPLVLRDLKGLSYEAIARTIDCPLGTVKSRIRRGRIRLQQHLRPLAREVMDHER